MKKCLSGILLGALVFCCGAAENYGSMMKNGHAARNKRDYAAAVTAYQKAETLAKSSWEKYNSLYYEQECLKSQRKYDEAIAVMKKVLKIEKVTPGMQSEALFVCAQLSMMKKDQKAAIQYYEQSAKIGQGWAAARSLSSHGELLRRQKKYAEAEKLYKEALKHQDPGSRQDAYCGLCMVYVATKKDFNTAMTPALQAEKEAAKLNDGLKSRALYYKVVVLAEYKKTDEAVKETAGIKEIKKPDKDWAAAAYCTAANAVFTQKKDVKTAKALMAEAAKFNAGWGFNKWLQKKLDAVK